MSLIYLTELFELASPATLASLIQDIDGLATDADTKQFNLRSRCYETLIDNVGEKQAAKMIGEPKPDPLYTCDICGKQSHDAPGEDWCPSYCDEAGDEEETGEPVCRSCCERYLTVNPNHGNVEPKPGFSISAARRFHAASHLTT